VKKLQSFRCQAERKVGYPCDIATRMGKACHESQGNRITAT